MGKRYLYLFQAVGTNRFKVGITDDVRKRLKSIADSSPFDIRIITKIKTPIAEQKEKQILKDFVEYVVKGEWMELDMYNLDLVLRDFIRDTNQTAYLAKQILGKRIGDGQFINKVKGAEEDSYYGLLDEFVGSWHRFVDAIEKIAEKHSD